jgi:hypothetical protein
MKNNNLKKIFEEQLRKTDFYKDLDNMDDKEKSEKIKFKNMFMNDFIEILEIYQKINSNEKTEQTKPNYNIEE